jgi:poly-gamma-glutamate synthesis protein (capsule biosynthesis protein)
MVIASTPVTIVAAGDLMLGSWTQDVILQNGYSYPFKNLEEILISADIVFANLEAPFGEGGEAYPKQYSFQVHPQLIDVISAGHINLVSIANNHIMDFGVESLKRTTKLLENNNIFFAGAGMELNEARKAALFSMNGQKIAFVAYSLTFPEEFWATDTSAGTCFPYHSYVYDDIKKLDSQNDNVIVSCHWGQESSETPKNYQIELAHKLIDAGADLILGHHPHVVQGIEYYKGKLIAYSLGNFIFGSYSKKAKESILLKLSISKTQIIRTEIIPINVFNEEVEFQPIILEDQKKDDFLRYLNKLSLELNKSPFVISSDGEIKEINSIN